MERDAALKILHQELRNINTNASLTSISALQQGSTKQQVSSSMSASTHPISESILKTMTSLEALELGEMELIVSRSNAEKKHMEIQMKASLVEVDELKESIETMQLVLDETRANNSKQKAKTRAVARVAVKKQKTNKAEVVRLRESIDLIRKEWTLPNTFKALQSSFDKSKKKIKSLKYEIASKKKEIKNIKEMNDPENQTTTNTTTNNTTTNNTTNNNTESETKSSSSSSGSKLNAEETLVEIKKYKLKIKKMNVESKRISVSMKELQNVHNKDMKVK